MRRTVLLALMVLVALTAFVPAAQAKFVFADLRGRTFTPGELIESQLAGCTARLCARDVGGHMAALVPAGTSYEQLCQAQRVPLAYVSRSGWLRFVMPKLETGRYEVVMRFRFLTNPRTGCHWGFASFPFRVVGDGG